MYGNDNTAICSFILFDDWYSKVLFSFFCFFWGLDSRNESSYFGALLFLPILRGPTVGTHDTHRGLKNGTNKKIVANSIIVGNTNSMNRSRIPSLVADDAYQLKFKFSEQSLTRRYTTRWHSGLRKTIILVLFDPMRQ